ncbi:MAG: metallophosphoesterase [Eubacterium sp.]|nr:metallophosphoesterase [Eubacterium sp.]
MMILARLLTYFLIFILFAYSLLRFFHLWKRAGLSNISYAVFQVLILGTLFVCQNFSAKIPGAAVKNIALVFSAVFLNIYLYTPVFCLIRELIRLILKKTKKKGKFYFFINHPAKSIYLFILISAVIGGLSFANLRWIRTTEYQVATEADMKGAMEIVFVSDCHISTGTDASGLDDIFEKIDQIEPDLLILGGDVVDDNSRQEDIEYLGKKLKACHPTYGIFSVEGESQKEQENEFENWMADHNVQMLKDQKSLLGGKVCLVGLRDRTDEKKLAVGDYLGQVDSKGLPTILVSHRPRILEEISKSKVCLTLCGHTEGGQYPIKNYIDLLANDMIYGQKKIGTMTAITSSGTGAEGIPSKIMAPSEIVKITFI